VRLAEAVLTEVRLALIDVHVAVANVQRKLVHMAKSKQSVHPYLQSKGMHSDLAPYMRMHPRDARVTVPYNLRALSEIAAMARDRAAIATSACSGELAAHDSPVFHWWHHARLSYSYATWSS
jgi:hypothetical protein